MAHFRFITRPFTRSFRTPKADSLGSILGLLPPCKDIIPVCQCNRSASLREFCASAEGGPSARVSEIVEEMAGLTLVESSHLMALLCERVDENGLPFMGIMMPGMGSGMGGGGGGEAAAKADEKPAEKTAFDLKLEGFDSGKKVNVIKEVRKFTDLGLKEAKELVEKAPIVLKKGISKEEAEIIIEKLKEVGAKAAME